MSSKFLMPLAADGLWKQPRKLRKSLKKFLEDSSAARVHQLRTRTRRMEAMVYALRLDFRKNERLLLKAIKSVRKKAGKVRDMDVLTGFASQPALNDEKECTVRLWNTWEVSVSYMLANLKRLPRCRRQKSEDASSEALGFSKMRSRQRRRQGRGVSGRPRLLRSPYV